MDKTQLQSEVDSTATAISAYCRTIDLFLKATREGIIPTKGSPQAETLREAWAGLGREVSFLRFLREGDNPAE